MNHPRSMKNNSKKLIVIAIASVAILGFAATLVNNYKTKTSFKHTKIAPAKPQQNKQDSVKAAVNENAKKTATTTSAPKPSGVLKVLQSDYTIGDKNAPVQMIEYASLSCPHCAEFTREAFDKVKKDYIDTGKVLFVFRHFPLNQPALTAAMFADCQAQLSNLTTHDKYFNTIKALFKTQDSWAFAANFTERLETIAKLDGMSSETFNRCITDEALKKNILTKRMSAAKSLNITSAPSFFINGEISSGYVDYLTIKKLIDKKLAEK